MIKGSLVVDGVVHGYNWTEQNWAIPEARSATAAGPGFHGFLSPSGSSRLTSEEFLRDWQIEDIEEALFLESQVDIAVYHGTPVYDLYKDGHSATSKGFKMKQRNPNRTFVYGAVNPLEGKKALDDMEKLVKEHRVDGIKVYAAYYSNGKTNPVNLDDPEFGFPFIERALELGVRVIATHKAIPFGPVNPFPYGLTDIPDAAARYPEMNFEIVHSGFAFLEDTALIAGAFSNVWLNLEVSGSFIVNAPRRFAEFIGPLLGSGAAGRIIHASGCPLVHPRPTIDAFLDFEMPQDLVDGFGYPQLTAEMKADILGANFLRLHGVDVQQLRAKIAGDTWSQRRADLSDMAEPWSHLRRRLSGVG
jgi:predicted TIM-barrel fold metal-dependent hydrolase